MLNTKIFVTYHKETPIINTGSLIPIQGGRAIAKTNLDMIGDDTGDNISDKNSSWCELTILYWMWKNVDADYYGLFHYRRLLDFTECGENYFYDFSAETKKKFGWDDKVISKLCKNYDMILPEKWYVHENLDYNAHMTIYDFYALAHIESDMQECLRIIDDKFPEYSSIADKVIKKDKQAHYCNMFIMKKELFQEYANWIFTILFEAEKHIKVYNDSPYQRRVFGFLSERLINVFIEHKRITSNMKIKELCVPFGVFDGKYPYGNRINNKPYWECANQYVIPTSGPIQSPMVSIIVPVYNVEKYLAACLNSLINQTLKEIEIIIVNDGTQDNSQEVIDTYKNIDKRITSIIKENGGLSSARNAGLAIAKGKYIMFVDSDDYLEPFAVARAYRRAEKDNLEVVMFTTRVVNADTELEVLDPYYNETHLPDAITNSTFTISDINDYLFKMQVSAWNKLYRKDLIDRIGATFPEGLCFEDNPFFLSTVINAKSIGYIKEHLYNYRVDRSGSILTDKKTRVFFDFFKIIDLCESIIKDNNKWDDLKSGFTAYKIDSIRHWHCMVHADYKDEYYDLMRIAYIKIDIDSIDKSFLTPFIMDTFVNVISAERTIPDERPNDNYLQEKTKLAKALMLSILKQRIKKYPSLFKVSRKVYRSSRTLLHKLKNRDVTRRHEELIGCNRMLTEQIRLLSDENKQLINKNISLVNDAKQLINESRQLIDGLYSRMSNLEFFMRVTLEKEFINSKRIDFSNCMNLMFYPSINKDDFDNIHENLPYFLNITYDKSAADAYFIWGIKPWGYNFQVAIYANMYNKPLFFLEDGFLRSICSYTSSNVDKKYKSGISFTVDTKTTYYDATQSSYLEDLLNTYEVSHNEIVRAKGVIDKIIHNRLSKYNNQDKIFLQKRNMKNILVVDQSYNDESIIKGLADAGTFSRMLEDAITENLDSRIYIKVHPDTIARNGDAYFKSLEKSGKSRIVLLNDPYNPIDLLQRMDKVYVVTSQLGFEAVLCGKEVHVYGMPFYAGWGVTKDRIECNRRQRKRSVEEIFYIAYIKYSYYVNPNTKKLCDIEEAIDFLIDLRKEYNSNYSMNNYKKVGSIQ